MARNAGGKPSFVEANGVRLCYEVLGDTGAEPLLLLSGLASQMINWRDGFCGGLLERGFRVIRFDNRDIGLSTFLDETGVPDPDAVAAAVARGEPPEIPYTLMDMAEDAAGLLDAMGLDAAHVLGSSMGGRIGQYLAIRHPERVLTLTSMVSHMGEPGYPPPDPDVLALLTTPAPRDRQGYVSYYTEVCRAMRGRIPLDEAHARTQAGRLYDRGFNPDGAARQYAALLAAGSAREELSRLETPTLIINGTDDPLISPDAARAMADVMPYAEFLLIEGMGHSVSECPDVWPVIISAVSSHAAKAHLR